MNKEITQIQLIQYIYNDGDQDLFREIELALLTDIDLQKEYASLKDVHGFLSEFSINPSETTLRIINEEAHGAESLELL